MHRYRLDLEYAGTPFVGWQRQTNGLTVQQVVEEALAAFSGEKPVLFGAGRTDAGVHALQQVAHVDLTRDWREDTVRDAVNHHLGTHPVIAYAVTGVPDDFHARFSAVERRYLYRIMDRRAGPALDRNRVWHVRQGLDADAMDHAGQVLVGQHDFTTFRSVQCQAESPLKIIDAVSVARAGSEIHIHVRARSFLHNQVRSFVGTLMEVGRGKWTRDNVSAALKARDRTACGQVAPPEGLYLATVRYSDGHV